MVRFQAVFVVVLLSVMANIQAEVYKSIDKDGNVTYSQTKPVDSDKVETIKTPKSAPPPPEAAPESSTEATAQPTEADPEQSGEKAQQDKEAEAQNAEIKKQNCDVSKKKLAELNNAGGRIKYVDEDGNTAWASEEQVAGRKAELQANIDKWCN